MGDADRDLSPSNSSGFLVDKVWEGERGCCCMVYNGSNDKGYRQNEVGGGGHPYNHFGSNLGLLSPAFGTYLKVSYRPKYK